MAGNLYNLGGGRPRKSTREKQLAGIFRADRSASDDTPLIEGSSVPPAYLDAAAKQLWHDTLAFLTEMRVFSASDREILARYRVLQSEFRRTYRGRKKDPLALKQLTALNGQIRALEDRLGLNPTARTRVKASAPPEQRPPNKLDRFLRQDGE